MYMAYITIEKSFKHRSETKKHSKKELSYHTWYQNIMKFTCKIVSPTFTNIFINIKALFIVSLHSPTSIPPSQRPTAFVVEANG